MRQWLNIEFVWEFKRDLWSRSYVELSNYGCVRLESFRRITTFYFFLSLHLPRPRHKWTHDHRHRPRRSGDQNASTSNDLVTSLILNSWLLWVPTKRTNRVGVKKMFIFLKWRVGRFRARLWRAKEIVSSSEPPVCLSRRWGLGTRRMWVL